MAFDPALPFTAAAACQALAAGTVTSRDLVAQCLARFEAHDDHLKSAVLLLGERALTAATQADAEIRAGRSRGPLHGVPFALKDIYDCAGLATTANSRLLLGHVPDRDSLVTQSLLEAGAILIGKLNTHEFATGGPAYDLPFPPARNPWSEAHFTGGSSSGSAAAVAAGLVPLAMGSDTLGSIRGPAGYCGIAGFKPTYDLVSRQGVVPLANSFDNCGPMAWTVEDCAMMMDALVASGSFASGLGRGIAGARIGVVRHFFEADIECDPEVRLAIEEGLRVLEGLGAKLIPVAVPAFADWDSCSRVIIYAEAYAIHERDLMTRPQDYAAITRARLFAGQVISAADYVQATRWRRALCRAYAQVMDGLDALVTGNTMTPAPRLDTLTGPPYFTWRYRMAMAPFNLTGAPALSVCAGFSSEGLPLSLQFAGRPFDDATVLNIGHAFERATPWRRRRPMLKETA